MKKIAAENLNEYMNSNNQEVDGSGDLTFEGWKDVLGVLGQMTPKTLGPSGKARFPFIIEFGEALMQAFELSGPEYTEFLDLLRNYKEDY